ncbi:helical backbone metal receptor [Desulfosarcina cetonica]|uniref:helical backbone metal receptor n=1 Tax=Desulfosarcina cetonica TaxID=90730 RepID=UPI0006CFBBF0|nr:helical backbone metal receptor [Desulfosarcina cetonica]
MRKPGLCLRWLLIVLAGWLVLSPLAGAKPVTVTDDAGRVIRLAGVPQRVVCLVPSATEMIFAIGAGDAVAGITHHSSALRGAAEKPLVGGFSFPSAERIMALKPDLVIASSLNAKRIAIPDNAIPVLVLDIRRMDDAFRHLRLMGTLFARQAEADALIQKNRRQLDLIARKVAQIPPERRKRVMRLMGKGPIMTPGSDSFQNEMIRAAGGIAPDFGQAGGAVPVSREQWTDFNPQVLYGCGWDVKADDAVFNQADWSGVDAVRQQRIYTLPCDLTCRAGVHLGDFVAWLASLIYSQEFADAGHEVLPRQVIDRRPVPIDLDYVQAAVVATSTIHDFPNKSLIVDFKTPRGIVSTLEGARDGILTVGNHYSSPPCWALTPMTGLDGLHQELYPVIGKEKANTTFLFTGANMDNLSVQKETYKEMTVYALVTAGVRGNAVRMSRDVGNYYEPGTINMIFLSNMRLTQRAMTRAIISATEGKSAALQDLDIRSAYLPLDAAATGTGTDNIIVVQGDGKTVDNAGGHCKLGELIARTAYAGVREAIFKQNGIVGRRDIFQRLVDRHISVSRLVGKADCDCIAEDRMFAGRVEATLLDPAMAGFLEAALAISDGAGRETVADLASYRTWCLAVAGRIAGRPLEELTAFVTDEKFPKPLAMALNAIFTGVSRAPGVHLTDVPMNATPPIADNGK